MDDVFLPTNKLIMGPKEYSNAMYIVLMGKVSELWNSQQTQQILRQVLFNQQQKKYNPDQIY